MTGSDADKPVTVARLRRMKEAGERIAALTAYDASFCALLEEGGVEVILVGDSLGMVVQGHDTTVPVTVEQMVYHTACVARARRRALLVADLPFLSYTTPEQALASSARLMQEGGAQMVKLEGGATQLATVEALAARGVPVCAHLGLQPQSVHKLGGFRVQGRDAEAARRMLADARALEAAGADLLILECVPRALAADIAAALAIPVIGIGAGPRCDGQILVSYDMLGIYRGRRPRFSRNFAEGSADLLAAVRAYVAAVKDGSFPGPEHGFD
ncbi:3-methyl-2-oxobutanoate hydroxymethyltransferase [Inmirania thermothiophila]|uniref:3-methyl-2-oxobutanoate hydroxymethyltransferase n=1 Tax=Inmirania thermothiophila TaxID=1750597 RepID=A0A3N1Y240_9GAMM|nr:3-methyl-2-oxobutanoate hydroxymethyltransferase [Inmirania thermothiophila]ROR32876.1 ketopantoate hydroxymethyltransferase [Inmirania thermothiophila]